MGYFDYCEHHKYLMRKSLIFLLFAKYKSEYLFRLNPSIVIVTYLRHLKDQAYEKEHYELLEVIKTILKEKEYEL